MRSPTEDIAAELHPNGETYKALEEIDKRDEAAIGERARRLAKAAAIRCAGGTRRRAMPIRRDRDHADRWQGHDASEKTLANFASASFASTGRNGTKGQGEHGRGGLQWGHEAGDGQP